MARYDKYEPLGGGFRARLAASRNVNTDGIPYGVGLDSNGRVVVGAGQSGVLGVMILVSGKQKLEGYLAGETVDVQTDGEIVDMEGDLSLDAGKPVYADNTTGLLSHTKAGGTLVGHTVEDTRIVVRMDNSRGDDTVGVLKFALVAGAAAGDITLAAIAVGDELVAVIQFTTAASIATAQNLTAEFSVLAGKINNTGGTNTTNNQLMVVYWDKT